MNKNNRLWRIAVSACLSALMAGASVCALMGAMQLPFSAAAAYLTALAASMLCGLAAVSGVMAAVSVTGLAALLGGISMAQSGGFAQLTQVWQSLTDPMGQAAMAELAEAGALLTPLCSVVLGAVTYVLIYNPGGTPFALLIEIAVLIGSYALCPSLPLAGAIPGLIAAVAAFAMSGGAGREGGVLRVLAPAVIAVCAAFLLVPQQGTVWEPMQQAGDRIRAVFEDYFRFTQERVPFTISTEGYDHAAEVNGSVVTLLGGPATPDPEEVLRVAADGDVLLRGSIRREYTGSAWTDGVPKARYLFYDFTRSRVREEVFDMEGNDAFDPVQATVSVLTEGTSTVFVPGRLEKFTMGPDTAVYYNSVGEMFLSRNARAGDTYSLIGYRTPDDAALKAAVDAAHEREDAEYDEILRTCTQLPEGIEEGVYALTMELTHGLSSDADKAMAIRDWLRAHCVYTLEPDYPDRNRDFVSRFVLETREGYCSYFASAMTVMCRIAGIPARYVEGYSVRTNGEPVTLTGEDAHAWSEVYFSGLGWVSFDASNGADGGEDGLSGETDSSDVSAEETEMPQSGDPEATMPPPEDPTIPPDDGRSDPSPTPTLPPEIGGADPTPSPTPDPSGWGNAEEPTPRPSGLPDSPQNTSAPPSTENDGIGRHGSRLWILAVIPLLLAAAVLWVRRRLAKADPEKLSEGADDRTAMLIYYRSTLTLLAHMGLSAQNGETPAAFARRVSAQTQNPYFVGFAEAVEQSVYARGGAAAQAAELGRKTYEAFKGQLRRGERIRFAMTRMLRGLGGFESIP